MDISCTSCGTKLKIPDSMLPPPQVRMVSITCPKCKSRLKIDRDQPGGGLAPQKKAEVKAQEQPAPKKKQVAQKPVQAKVAEEKEETKRPIFEYEYDEVGRRTQRADQLGNIENYTYELEALK